MKLLFLALFLPLGFCHAQSNTPTDVTNITKLTSPKIAIQVSE
ncbi:MAG TPA: hypothetical protein VEV15_13480 [Flavisolibacter sp.]|nr:hypothetical protein [Flavisolibacter sp.]